MKGVVIYKSRYGATRQYAQWLSTELELPMMATAEISVAKLNEFDFVIMGSSVYIGKLLIKSWLQDHAAILQKKKLFLFVVCGTPASDTAKTTAIVAKNLPLSLASRCQVFFLQGRLNLEKLSFTDRFALRFGARFEKDPILKQRMMLGYNEVKRENLEPLLKVLTPTEVA
jgi:menaquinone-dependent protoporphyrinogen IX oxidase